MDAVTRVPVPVNEPVLGYAPGSPERASLRRRLAELSGERRELPCVVGGRRRPAGGPAIDVVAPHRHAHVLGTTGEATDADVADAVTAALDAAPSWRALPFDERAAVLLRAADLLAGPWRDTLNATTMLGQSKTAHQAEIDAACELADFWRFNVAFARRALEEQPLSSPGQWNRMDHRPLEGFVLAVTPFNFTSIAGNLPTAPALMGCTVVWKPSPTQQLAADATLRLLEAAGLPPGVVNLVTGNGDAVSRVALAHPDLAGVHFTGSTRTFQHLWRTVGANVERYRGYPRLVGETGGKDFVVAHASADPDALATALVRGAFEYQGQKCSAVSRAYVPRAMWESGLREALLDTVRSLRVGDPCTDWSAFMGAVIDRRAYDRLEGVLERVRADAGVRVLAGGGCDGRTGFFVEPTVVQADDPRHDVFVTEYFGPLLGVLVYDEPDFDDLLAQVGEVSSYALTGAVFARDRGVVDRAVRALRYCAGNLYVNDKPTGAVVGQQPFGGARASGTNDKAGSVLNLLRWTSPRAVKETFVPATDHRYPHMQQEG